MLKHGSLPWRLEQDGLKHIEIRDDDDCLVATIAAQGNELSAQDWANATLIIEAVNNVPN